MSYDDDWKQKINEQIDEAARMRCIGGKLKKLSRELLEADTPFDLIYSSSRGSYIKLRFLEEPSKLSSKIVLKSVRPETFGKLKEGKQIM
jgi:hypothetical protein